MNKPHSILLALLFIFVAGCQGGSGIVKPEKIRVLQAEPKEQYTVVGEVWAYGGNSQWASERLQYHSYRLGAEAVILQTTQILPGVDGPVVKVTGTAIRYSSQ